MVQCSKGDRDVDERRGEEGAEVEIVRMREIDGVRVRVSKVERQ